MKLLMCGRCSDVRALDPGCSWTACRCGNAAARWVDPRKGTVSVRAEDRSSVRIIGMHNSFLEQGYRSAPMPSASWQTLHQHVVDTAEGYLFHRDRRACWACVVRVGESNDVSWEEPG